MSYDLNELKKPAKVDGQHTKVDQEDYVYRV
jgi:hypothetical protein